MASSPPGSPSHWPLRPASALVRPPGNTNRLSTMYRVGGSNKMIEENTKCSVKVVVRVRPPLQPIDPGYDLIPQRFQRSMVQVTSPTNLVIDCPQGRRLFTFDRVFDENINQAGIWEYLEESINVFVQGYNVSMLAYGQSGAGKSYTMGTSGLAEQCNTEAMGVIPRAAAALFEKLEGTKPNIRHSMPSLRTPAKYSSPSATCSSPRNPTKYWTLKASYVEIYNEQLRDLLVPETTPSYERQNVIIREDVKGQIILSGLHQIEINSVEDMMSALNYGSMIRQTDSTAINAKSSRSHAVFSLNLVQHKNGCPDSFAKDKYFSAPLESDTITVDSKFHFVDLAGSERLKNTGAQGERAKEGISINAGLASLGKVISQLSCRQAGSHVSYRDSKLTRLLQDSLGGNAITYMIACITPVEFHMSETLNTLQYAQRARAIQSKPRIQHVSEDTDKQAVIKRLKAEVAFLRDKIRNTERGGDRHCNSGNTDDLERTNDREQVLENQLFDIQEKYTAMSQRHAKFISDIAKARENELAICDTLENASGERATERLERSNYFSDAIAQALSDYQNVIQNLEKSLSETRSSLATIENKFLEKETKYSAIETLNQQLQARLQKLVERETSTENYLHDLEAKLDSHTSGEEKNSAIVVELRKEIARVRENEASCEDYISTLEERLAEADQDVDLMQREIDRLEYVVERQRSLGKLDCLLYELDHIQKDNTHGDETYVTNGDLKNLNGHTRNQSRAHKRNSQNVISENDEDDEFAVSNSAIRAEIDGPVDHGESIEIEGTYNSSMPSIKDFYPLPSPAQSKFVEDKLENISQELFDLRVEHESTLNEYDIISAKYEEALRALAELQDSVDGSNRLNIRNTILLESSGSEITNSIFPSNIKLNELKNGEPCTALRSLSSELLLSEEFSNTLGLTDTDILTESFDSETTEDSFLRKNALLEEFNRLRKITAEREKAHYIVVEKLMMLEKEHVCALELVEELKNEVNKAKMNQSDASTINSPMIRRKSSQNVMTIEKAHRAFASLRNIGSESFESNPDKLANFEFNLNTAMHELHARSERIQELEADMTATKRELESKMTIISGLTRERSSLQSAPAVASAMNEQLLQIENRIKGAYQAREQELNQEVSSLRATLGVYTSRSYDEDNEPYNEQAKQRTIDLEAELAGCMAKHEAVLKTLRENEFKYKETIANLEMEISKSSLNSELENNRDNDRLCAKLQRENADYKMNLEANMRKVLELEKAHTQAHKELYEVTNSKDEALYEIDYHKSFIAQLQRQIDEHDNIVNRLQQDLNYLRENYHKDLNECKSVIQAETETQISKLESAHIEKVTCLQEELARAQQELTSIATEVANAIGVEVSMEELQDRVTLLLDDRKTLSEESELCNRLKEEVDDLSITNTNLAGQIDQIGADITDILKNMVDNKYQNHRSIPDQLIALRKEIIDLSAQNEKNARLVQELEDQLASSYDQNQKFSNRLSVLQSEHTAQVEESNTVTSHLRAELEAVKEEFLNIQSKLDINSMDNHKLLNSNGHLRKSPSITSLPSPPPVIPLPPLPSSISFNQSGFSSISSISGQVNRPPSKDLAAQQIHDDQELRIRTIEKHLSAEKQLTQTLEEALTDLEKQSKKLRSDSEAWKKRCIELETEVKELREKEKNSNLDKGNRWSMLQVEEERKKRRDAEIARAQLEERMNAINKKKKKASLNCF
ncbi:putative kinesin family protein [Erysiphe neolycopersici]|uniref:Putative kinesin family protein n=1 Tax=Erysiphe neolycopersici TaxID=212602 RepID=A0A420HRY4_9PEZI|nr:putative kinesin family protein [Erysiphe neolycopersici]